MYQHELSSFLIMRIKQPPFLTSESCKSFFAVVEGWAKASSSSAKKTRGERERERERESDDGRLFRFVRVTHKRAESNRNHSRRQIATGKTEDQAYAHSVLELLLG